MAQQENQQHGVATQSLIRKLTTEKAVKAHRQQTPDKDASEDDIANIRLAARGIKAIESLDLPSLRRLDLSKNNLNRLKGLQGCPQVTYLTAAGNELTGEGLDGVRPLKDLKVLNASGNHVRRIPPAVFAQFRQLQALVLNNNEISEVPPTWFKKGLLSLNTLVLSHNQVKSLSDSGLGRLTGLTKLSVSHNTLVELPDLSACSGLEELRAAHNLISQVPATLSKNAALRTLDLGHNRIDKWVGLERLGKTLKSLMQLSLAGNPICGPPTTAPSEEKEGGGREGEGDGEGEGEYVAKVRSLFPGLKVRDGKRILMKKSHTYYETRRAEEGGGGGGSGADDASGPVISRRKPGQAPVGRGTGGPTAKPGGDEQRAHVVGDRNKKAKKKSRDVGVGPGGRGSEGSPVDTAGGGMEAGAGEEITGKAERKLKKKAARAAAAAAAEASAPAGAEAEAEAATPAKLEKKTKKRRRREAEAEAEEERRSRSPTETAAAASFSPKSAGDKATSKKKQSGQSSQKVGASAAADTKDAGTAEAASKHETTAKKKRKKTKQDGSKSSSGGGGGGRGVQQQEDPYSSSEELPIPGAQAKRSAVAPAAAPAGGDRESGVVSVIINKKRGGKGATARPRQGGAAGADGRPGGAREFSVDAMLEARGQKETIGLGSGVSAW